MCSVQQSVPVVAPDPCQKAPHPQWDTKAWDAWKELDIPQPGSVLAVPEGGNRSGDLPAETAAAHNVLGLAILAPGYQPHHCQLSLKEGDDADDVLAHAVTAATTAFHETFHLITPATPQVFDDYAMVVASSPCIVSAGLRVVILDLLRCDGNRFAVALPSRLNFADLLAYVRPLLSNAIEDVDVHLGCSDGPHPPDMQCHFVDGMVVSFVPTGVARTPRPSFEQLLANPGLWGPAAQYPRAYLKTGICLLHAQHRYFINRRAYPGQAPGEVAAQCIGLPEDAFQLKVATPPAFDNLAVHGNPCKGLACATLAPPPASHEGQARGDNVVFLDTRPLGLRPSCHYQLGNTRHIPTVLCDLNIFPPAGLSIRIDNRPLRESFVSSASGDTLVLAAYPEVDVDFQEDHDEHPSPPPSENGSAAGHDDHSSLHDSSAEDASSSGDSFLGRPRSRSPRRYGGAGCTTKLSCHDGYPFPIHMSAKHAPIAGEAFGRHLGTANLDLGDFRFLPFSKPFHWQATLGTARLTQEPDILVRFVVCYVWAIECLIEALVCFHLVLTVVQGVGAPRACKGHDGPGTSATPAAREAHQEARLYAPPGAYRDAYQREPPDFEAQPAIGQAVIPPVFRPWHFLILTPEYAAEEVAITLHVPCPLSTAVAAIAEARDVERQSWHSLLIPVEPQPEDDFGTLLAMPGWAEDYNVVCIDARLCNGRIFSLLLPEYLKRESLLIAAGLDHFADTAVYVGDSWVQLGREQFGHLYCGVLITFAPQIALYRPGLHLQQMLLRTDTWTEAPAMPEHPPGRAIWVLTDAMPVCFDASNSNRANFRSELALRLLSSADRIAIQPAVPMLQDYACRGHPCDRLIVATERIQLLTVPPYRRTSRKTIFFLDKRPILQGVVWGLVDGGRIPASSLLDMISEPIPPRCRIAFTGGTMERGWDQTWMHVQAGQVLTAHFVAEEDSSPPPSEHWEAELPRSPPPEPDRRDPDDSDSDDVPMDEDVPSATLPSGFTTPPVTRAGHSPRTRHFGTKDLQWPSTPGVVLRKIVDTYAIVALAFAFCLGCVMWMWGSMLHALTSGHPADTSVACLAATNHEGGHFSARHPLALTPSPCTPQHILTALCLLALGHFRRSLSPAEICVWCVLCTLWGHSQPGAAVQIRAEGPLLGVHLAQLERGPSGGNKAHRTIPTPCRARTPFGAVPGFTEAEDSSDDEDWGLVWDCLGKSCPTVCTSVAWARLRQPTLLEQAGHDTACPAFALATATLEVLFEAFPLPLASKTVRPAICLHDALPQVPAQNPRHTVGDVHFGGTPLGFTWPQLLQLDSLSVTLTPWAEIISRPAFQNIPTLHSQALGTIQTLSQDGYEGILCFTDGWACIFVDLDHGAIGAGQGHVPLWALGSDETLSAYTAECFALAVAALGAKAGFSSCAVTYLSDCTSALRGAEGRFACKRGGCAQAMCHAFDFRRGLSFPKDRYDYVPGHKGHLFNELADGLAKEGAHMPQVATCLGLLPDALHFWLSAGAGHLPWATLALQQLRCDATLPKAGATTLGHDMWHLGLSHEQMLKPFLPADLDCTHATPSPDMQSSDLRLRIASFNTLSLGACLEDDEGRGSGEQGLHQRPARAALLAKQLVDCDISVAALQETRCPQGSSKIGGYLRFSSGAPKGQHGTELWFREGHLVLTARDGNTTSAVFAEQHFVVCHADPRRIVARYVFGKLALLFCSLHAPHRATERQLIADWWQETSRLIAKFRRQDPVIIAGDLNCSVGSVPSEHVSSVFAEEEDAPGAQLHDLLRACQCWLPCTFDNCQIGPAATFHQKRNGKPCRPDLVAVPQTWQSGCCQAWTDPGIQVASTCIDHTATILNCAVRMCMPLGKKLPRRVRLPPQMFADPALKEDISDLLRSTPQVPWKASVHAHAAVVVDHLQQGLAKLVPTRPAKPHHVYLQDSTWTLQQRVTSLKRGLSRLQEQTKWNTMAFIFARWREQPLSSAATPWSGAWADKAMTSAILHYYHIRIGSKQLRIACKQDRALYTARLAEQLATGPNTEVHDALHKLLRHKRKKPYAPEPLPQVRDAQGNLCEDADAALQRWREYFASMEAGSAMTPRELGPKFDVSPPAWPEPQNTSELPTKPDLIRLMLSAKCGKAAGMDGLPNEFLRSFAPHCAEVLYPLLLKLIFRGQEAMGLKGGMAVWFHKGRGAKDTCESFRQIILLPCFAKILHQAVRPAIRDLYVQGTPSLQLGGKPGQAVCFGAHLVRSFLRRCLRRKESCFVLFSDIASAFYAVVRQLVAAPCHTGPGTAPLPDEICQGLGLSSEEIAALKAHVQGRTGLSQAGASDWLESMAQQLSDRSWFVLRGDSKVVLTARGTRPGSSWADILFGMVIGRVLKERDTMEGLGATSATTIPSLPWDGQKTLNECADHHPQISIGDLIWADDTATLRIARSTPRLDAGIASCVGSLCDAFANFGFRMSFGPNKTAILAQAAGPGSRKARHTLFGPTGHNGSVSALRETSMPVKVPLVAAYKHLGVLQSVRGSLLAEIKYRAAQSWAAFSEGRHKVYKAKGVPISRRAFILKSSVLPKLLYGSGSWPPLLKQELQALSGTLWAMYRAICGIPASSDQHFHTSTILVLTGLPGPQVQLHVQRLLYLRMLIKSGPDELWASIRSDPGYLTAMREALEWMYAWTFRTCPLQHPISHWEDWCNFACAHPGRYKGLLLRAQGLECCRQQVVASLEGLYKALKGLAPPQAPSICMASAFPEACIPCGKLFTSRVAWSGHAARMHGYRSKAFLLGRSPLCYACGKTYGTVGRLRRHLLSSGRCIAGWGRFTPSQGDAAASVATHPLLPPIPIPGTFGSSLDPDPSPAYSEALLAILQDLPEVDESVVWEAVADFIEPLEILRATVRHWADSRPHDSWVTQSAENVLLLLDPELIGEPDTAARAKADRHAFAMGSQPDWAPLPSFSLPACAEGPCFDLQPPPPVVLSPFGPTSTSLRLGQAYSSWLEQACTVIAQGLEIATKEGCTLQIRCSNFDRSLGPAKDWLTAAGFSFCRLGLRSSPTVSPEFTC
ncbi:unnamed protein product [Symbiodinium sp. CCMP2592]|nr:unnamed protein product [Symbiodinium sp. CCMP2592]